MLESAKKHLKNNTKFLSLLLRCYNLFLSRNFKVDSKNISEFGTIILTKSKLKIKGINNKIIIEDFAKLRECTINIFGSNNIVFIGRNSNLNKTNIFIEGNNNEFYMGRNTTTNSFVGFNVLDGTKITIGEDCMFSRNINLWTGDYHSIINFEGERTNISENITIGDHVWIGVQSNILKGATISNNSVVGAMSLITKKFTQENVIIAGVPAKIISENTDWTRENILANT